MLVEMNELNPVAILTLTQIIPCLSSPDAVYMLQDREAHAAEVPYPDSLLFSSLLFFFPRILADPCGPIIPE